MKSFLILTVSAFAPSALAQTLAEFTTVDFTGPFIEGENVTLQWTVGNGLPVSANLWSGNYSQPIFTNLSSLEFIYTIPPVAEGSYSMQLVQGGIQTEISPLFSIFTEPLNTTATSSSTMAAATGTGVGPTVYVYFDEHCGCTKTALTPQATPAPAGQNYTTPPITTPASPAPQIATYRGDGIVLHVPWLPALTFGIFSGAMLV